MPLFFHEMPVSAAILVRVTGHFPLFRLPMRLYHRKILYKISAQVLILPHLLQSCYCCFAIVCFRLDSTWFISLFRRRDFLKFSEILIFLSLNDFLSYLQCVSIIAFSNFTGLSV